MQKFQEKLMKYFMPVANWISNQKQLQAIKDGMISTMPIVIVGSFCTLLFGIDHLFGVLGWTGAQSFIMSCEPFITFASSVTSDFVALYATYFIAKSLSEKYNLKGNQPAITALIAFFIVAGLQYTDGGFSFSNAYLGAGGLFTGIIIAIVVIGICNFCLEKSIYIKMPENVPPMVQDSFASLIPLAINVFLAVIVADVCGFVLETSFPQIIMNVLAPVINSLDSLPALLLIMFIAQILWFFGIHGPSVTEAVWGAFAVTYTAENMELFAKAGMAVEQASLHIFTYGFFYAILTVTGSGITIGLNLLLLKSKCKSYKAVGKAAIVPSLFGINEPLIFGTPIILNPYMFIPFVFGPIITTSIAWFAMDWGIVGKPIQSPPGFLPPGIGAFLATLDWKAAVLVFVLIIIMTLIYYPFFKTMEAEELKKETNN